MCVCLRVCVCIVEQFQHTLIERLSERIKLPLCFVAVGSVFLFCLLSHSFYSILFYRSAIFSQMNHSNGFTLNRDRWWSVCWFVCSFYLFRLKLFIINFFFVHSFPFLFRIAFPQQIVFFLFRFRCWIVCMDSFLPFFAFLTNVKRGNAASCWCLWSGWDDIIGSGNKSSSTLVKHTTHHLKAKKHTTLTHSLPAPSYDFTTRKDY